MRMYFSSQISSSGQINNVIKSVTHFAGAESFPLKQTFQIEYTLTDSDFVLEDFCATHAIDVAKVTFIYIDICDSDLSVFDFTHSFNLTIGTLVLGKTCHFELLNMENFNSDFSLPIITVQADKKAILKIIIGLK